MQGKKNFTPKLFYSLSLDSLVPPDDFYRQVGRVVDFQFLYKQTVDYYGREGQASIDPVVFFKICMVGYLNNITSDRALIRFCANSLNIRLFLGYDLDEQLPWHSTISRTRQLYGEEVFLSLFQEVLRLCVAQGMVSGKRQAIDSAFIKANASMDSLLEKEVVADVSVYADELNSQSEFQVTAEKKREVARHHAWQKRSYATMPGSKFKKGKLNEKGEEIRPQYLSNHTHYSPTDNDARISTKPGKPRQLNYFGQVGVDTKLHVITAATADFADKRDSECLPKLTEQMLQNLQHNKLTLEELLADTGYSSGEVLRYLEEKGIAAWIPNFGQFKMERKGFIFNKSENRYECQRGNRAHLPYKHTRADRGYNKLIFKSSTKDCKTCRYRESCCGKRSNSKRLSHTEYYDEYERQHHKLTQNENYTRKMSRRRSATVEPVLGTLINFVGMKKVYTRGIAAAEKHVLMASLCYNLKKMLGFVARVRSQAKAQAVQVVGKLGKVSLFCNFDLLCLVLLRSKPSQF